MPEILHVAILPDGNRRYATRHGITDHQVIYRIAASRLLDITGIAFGNGVTHLTLWGSSCENRHRRSNQWNIDVEEVFQSAVRRFAECGAKMRIAGEWRDAVSQETAEIFDDACARSSACGLDRELTLLIDYNGDREVDAAIRALFRARKVPFPELVNAAEALRNASWTGHLPDVDFLIRPGAYDDPHNSANFLPLLTGNTQYCFPPEFWPEYGTECFRSDLSNFRSRERRHGR